MRKVFICYSLENIGIQLRLLKVMSAMMIPKDTNDFFHRLSPLIVNAKCEALKFYPAKAEVFSLVSPFFNGKAVHEIIAGLVESKENRYYQAHVHTFVNAQLQFLAILF